jgi:hypothetical protein
MATHYGVVASLFITGPERCCPAPDLAKEWPKNITSNAHYGPGFHGLSCKAGKVAPASVPL